MYPSNNFLKLYIILSILFPYTKCNMQRINSFIYMIPQQCSNATYYDSVQLKCVPCSNGTISSADKLKCICPPGYIITNSGCKQCQQSK